MMRGLLKRLRSRRKADEGQSIDQHLGDANLAIQAGQYERAKSHLGAVLKFEPRHPYALYAMANCEMELRNDLSAIEFFLAIEDPTPFSPAYFKNLSLAYERTQQLDMAVETLKSAADPTDPRSRFELARLLLRTGQYQQARDCVEDLDEDVLPAERLWLCWGNLHIRLGQPEAAIKAYTKVLEMNPDNPIAHWGIAWPLLQLGDFKRGWQEYEWRYRATRLRPKPISAPLWQGEPLAGKRIYIYSEQGYGDTIQFLRYLRMLKEQGAHVIFRCQTELESLIRRYPYIDEVVTENPPGSELDFHHRIMSLPQYFSNSVEEIPDATGYLRAEPELCQQWKQRLDSHNALKRIGLVWSGNPDNKVNRDRRFQLDELLNALSGYKANYYSLQLGEPATELAELRDRFEIEEFAADLTDFEQTAAVMSNLDLVISPCTAVTHLAGALGRPCWVLLSYNADWRWLRDRDDSPWYSSLRLFRQTQLGDWAPVFKAVATQLGTIQRGT